MKFISDLISVIVPVHNGERHLEEALSSLCAQTYTQFECICIDDGSTDNSREIIESFAEKDSRFRLIHQGNKGVAAARNRGLDEANMSEGETPVERLVHEICLPDSAPSVYGHKLGFIRVVQPVERANFFNSAYHGDILLFRILGIVYHIRRQVPSGTLYKCITKTKFYESSNNIVHETLSHNFDEIKYIYLAYSTLVGMTAKKGVKRIVRANVTRRAA